MIPKWNTDFVQPWKTEDGFKSQDAWEENMKKTVFVLLDACQYEAGTRNLGYLEHMVDAGHYILQGFFRLRLWHTRSWVRRRFSG